MNSRPFAPLLALAICASPPALAAHGPDPHGAIGTPDPRPLAPIPCGRDPLCPSDVTFNGEAWSGNATIWQTDFFGATLQQIDLAAACRVLATCPAPGASSPSELAFDGAFLYHYDFGTGLIYKIDPVTCATVATCDAPGDDLAEGLAWDGRFLWKGDSQFLYRFTPPPDCQVVQVCPNPIGDSADGLAYCGTFLVMLGYSGMLYQLDPESGCAVVGACPLNQGALGNGIDSDGLTRLFVDGNPEGFGLDRVTVDCSMPVPARPRSWGSLKTTYR